MNAKVFATVMLAGLAFGVRAEADDYGAVTIKPKNPRIGNLPKVKAGSTKPSPEWVKDTNGPNLGLWDPSTSKYLVVLTPSTSTDPDSPGAVKITPKNPRTATLPKLHSAPSSSKPTLEWVSDPSTGCLGLYSTVTHKYIVIFQPKTAPPAPSPAAPSVPPSAPSAPEPATAD